MLATGEDIRFIARRLVILSSEDIGNANPFALTLAMSCFEAVEVIGEPEAHLILAQTVLFLSCCPKSNASCKALVKAMEDVKQGHSQDVPQHLRTHAKQYQYPHDWPTKDKGVGGYIKQDYGAKKRYYFPLDVGEERKIKDFLQRLDNFQQQSCSKEVS